MIAGIDSNILIYAGLVPKSASSSAASPEQQELTRRAKILLHELREAQVVLPMDAIAELLIPVPKSKHGLVIIALRELFICPDFNDQAASIAADLWAKYKGVPTDQKYENKHVMRADAKIVATAKAAGATVFYSNDANCRTLANLIMAGKELPKASQELFIDQILEDGMESKPTGGKKSRKPRKKKA